MIESDKAAGKNFQSKLINISVDWFIVVRMIHTFQVEFSNVRINHFGLSFYEIAVD